MATSNEKEIRAVRDLQRYLRTLAYHDARLPAPPIDGVFGKDTEAAVIAFQEREGLPPTGRVDLALWELIYAAYQRTLKEKDGPGALAVFPRLPEDYTLEVGDGQFLVSILQFALAELAVLYEELEAVKISGVFDEVTARGVRHFQEKNGLPATGGVDRATWNEIADAYNRTFDTYFRQ